MSAALVTGRPWRRAMLWLVVLSAFFYASYGFSNWLASQRADVWQVVYDWERGVPFVAWTIVPYWSINAFYAVSLFVCSTQRELSVHVRRLLTAQIVAVVCFLLVPLRMTFDRPPTDGVPGFMFAVLGGFDKPFNQAPSLHIALLFVLADLYHRHVAAGWRWLLHGWFALVGISVLTTYQHHFIDIPTGATLGFLVLWLFPWQAPPPLRGIRFTQVPRRRLLALRYAVAAALVTVLASAVGGVGLALLWLALSLALVAAAYAFIGARAFQKDERGRLSVATWLLFLPYLISAWINARLWTRHDPPAVHVIDDVWIGRMPLTREMPSLPTRQIVDLCAELSSPRELLALRTHPALDLVPVEQATIRAAAASIEALRKNGPVLVVCALGYGRSAAAIAAWLLLTGRAADATEAVAIVRKAKPRIVLEAGAVAVSP